MAPSTALGASGHNSMIVMHVRASCSDTTSPIPTLSVAATEITFFHFAVCTGLASSCGLGARFRGIAVTFQLSLEMNEIGPHHSIRPGVLNPSCDELESTLVCCTDIV